MVNFDLDVNCKKYYRVRATSSTGVIEKLCYAESEQHVKTFFRHIGWTITVCEVYRGFIPCTAKIINC
jgi:hypothetical protein